jgi:hypothetical protein
MSVEREELFGLHLFDDDFDRFAFVFLNQTAHARRDARKEKFLDSACASYRISDFAIPADFL